MVNQTSGPTSPPRNYNGIYWIVLVAFAAVISVYIAKSFKNIQVSFNSSRAAGATLSLSPVSTTIGVNQNFNVDINVNTGGFPIDGVDVYSLRFNPNILQVVDSNSSVTGVQITPGTTLPQTNANTVNNSAGTIQFAQTTSGGTTFNGSGKIGTVTFKAIANGSSAVTFDFSAGSTADSNVTSGGVDQLTSVTNGNYTVDAALPTVSITTPTNNASVSGTTTISANATDNVGVVGVQFKLDGSNLGIEDTSSPFSISWDTSSTSNGSHTLTATARDNVGNTATSTAITVTVNNADTTAPVVTISAPSNGATVSTTVTVSATATDNVGVAGVQFKLDGVNLGAEDTASPYSISWNTASVTNGSHILTATARDAASNATTSAAVSVSVNNLPTTVQRVISLNPEGRTSKAVSGTVDILNSSKVLIRSYNFTTDSSGNTTITFDYSGSAVYLKVRVAGYLYRMVSSVDLAQTSLGTVSVPLLLAGDFNSDNIINSLDYSFLNGKWFGQDALADMNQDGIVNTIDFSYLNKNWLITGDQ